ncbi:proprotein convertase P-domain-containing protein [Flavobacterium sp. SM15]|uniref:zinc-dependent metalloprotease n=1 Tax=Flavobacterium sp. SM15 TaxID=2908005 RepID=UPI001EDB0E48|nr:zinc-dependent metalloprotease family protein [Flavobacterium sp. SM15]MCG2612169.1 proprotein convertase P-domain-containing protein [Flavobacterium sp. SM15]
MKRILLFSFVAAMSFSAQAQTEKAWSPAKGRNFETAKGVKRQAFPKKYDLYQLDINPIKQALFSAVDKTSRQSVIISLPTAKGGIEQFEMYEASNFEADLQAQFPEIRAFSGRGITDRYATVKLSISPQGIQTMIFRADKESEFMEPYSKDRTVYAVYNSQREKGKYGWACSTDDKHMMENLDRQIPNTNKSDAGQLKTMRLAQSCNGEYANYHGASTAGTAADKAMVLAAFNATLTRCNGVYEKDLALHLNLVASTTNVIYCNPATDPYSTTLSQWNAQLQNALSSSLTGPSTSLAANNAAYDIGHMFGASGGGGNAGCIGCVCVNDTSSTTDNNKGSGITSPADGIPEGDNFDIDYVVHEVGHQLGGNHTFSNSNEGSGVNKEVGSGVTIMGYAGITSQDVAPHSIDIYHEATIAQIQANLATKTCPVTTPISANNVAPVVSAVANFSIPINTPFVLTGAATDANNDPLTYCWEQNDDGGAQTGASSGARANKPVGPNFISWLPTASPSRYFPKIESIVANSATTSQVGGDAGMLSEALSSVARDLNFRLTVRDNAPYSSTAPVTVGQTSFTDMKITTVATAGPFTVTGPNTAVSWAAGTNQTITWNVANTDIAPINAKYVDIYLSTDGGYTYPTLLASRVPNDGSETITVPNNLGSANRYMVKANGNVFFDISNINSLVPAGGTTFSVAFNGTDGGQNKSACQGTDVSYDIVYKALNGFSGTTSFSATGNPAGSTVTFSPSTISADGTVTMTISNTATATPGIYNIMVTATSGATSKTVPYYFELFNSSFTAMSLTTPADNANGQGLAVNLTWAANGNATNYDVQVATDNAFTNIISSGNSASTNYSVSGLNQATDYFWRVLPKNSSCSGVYSTAYKFTTGTVTCANASSTNIPLTISASGTPTINSTLSIPAGGTISDVNLTMNVTHSWINDLTATLISPTGTQVQLYARPCTNTLIQNINATFDDSGIAVVCGTNPGISGTVKSTQALSAFNGENSTGTWTLRISDAANQDGGSLNSWSLNICTVTALGTQENNQLDGFTIYPNPNNGAFNIRLNSTSGNDIKINVHDISGRLVFDKSYSNTGAFDQNLQLNNVQAGIYIVTVQDGDKKEAKRIAIQ